MITLKRILTVAVLFVFCMSVAACDSGGNGDDGGNLDADAYRLSGTPSAQVLVSIQTADGGAATGGGTETTTIGDGGTVTESLDLASDVIGVRVTVDGGQGASSLELLSGNEVIDSASGTSGELVVEDGDVSALP